MADPLLESTPSIWRSSSANLLGRFTVLIIVFGFFAWQIEDGAFYTPRNLESIARQSAVYATAALGMTLVIITAGIDLSVGAIIALTVVGVAWILNLKTGEVFLINRYPIGLPVAAILGSIVLATLAGLANGAMIVRFRITPFIVTLGTMGIFRGLAKGIADEKDIYPEVDCWISTIMDPTLTNPDRSWMLLPPGVWILLVSAIGAAAILRYTRLGRHIYAVGSNEETARLCGVQVGRTKLIVYMLAGFFAGLAGLMQFSFISGIGQPTTGISYELFVIAAVVIGGASLMGGEGTILGSIIGALLITILNMGGQQVDWPKWVQEMVIGGIIIGAAGLDQLRHRGKS
ncbi:MAG: ribose/xylose/arabinose/galactoside ABC-type transport system permease subunit [Mariniblastus sp.]|jgi:ribose/xylose/arabinose/galactoside ABC-type transport system permease subunit